MTLEVSIHIKLNSPTTKNTRKLYHKINPQQVKTILEQIPKQSCQNIEQLQKKVKNYRNPLKK